MRKRLLPITAKIMLFSGVLLLGACSSQQEKPAEETTDISGARSAIFALLRVEDATKDAHGQRPGALLGLYVTEYLSQGTSIVRSALSGIEAQTALAAMDETVQDPDFALLQAFADALQVDVPELLNRSTDRTKSLEKYLEALRNVGSRAQERVTELDVAVENARKNRNDQRKALTALKREQGKAVNEKDFSRAGELQEDVSEGERTLSETELQLTQTEDVLDILKDLIDIYGERLLAIETNREALLQGVTVVDVPGAEEDLDVIQRLNGRERREATDSLFEGNEVRQLFHIDGE